ncbi:MAG: acetyl-CoA decarbonylase/synthase complex subunit gamma [Thermodesulfobacteriota bacterium]|nr:acetyl-CoA decarbonylase/synthase complex subunit gamma [Thermodesulfobacteriota bacterium]
MALSGIEIFKKLPKKNCGECGVPTCLAFAMKLATGQAELAACPYVSDDVRAEIDEASAPPIRTLTIGTGDRAVKLGGETVMFRHEKRFENPPGLALMLSDTMDDSVVNEKLSKFKDLEFERVGLILRPQMLALKEESGDAGKFAAFVKRVIDQMDAAIILMSDRPEVISEALKVSKDKKPLIYAATKDTAEAMGSLAKESACPLAVRGAGLDEVMAITDKLLGMGLKDLVIDSQPANVKKALEDQVVIRRSALVKKVKQVGFPTITFPGRLTDSKMKEALIASMLIAKYAGIIVLSEMEGHNVFPLLLDSLNIYTDPQRPMAVEEKVYEIGGPREDSPVLITSNFSLTYFIVSGEVESSRVPAWLLIKDTEGLSVLTAWAAGKFAADTVAVFVKKSGIADRVKHRKLVIPGYLAGMSGELEEELPDWQILVGPREAAHLSAYLKQWSA